MKKIAKILISAAAGSLIAGSALYAKPLTKEMKQLIVHRNEN